MIRYLLKMVLVLIPKIDLSLSKNTSLTEEDRVLLKELINVLETFNNVLKKI
ncbi:MAG: hypothetical protein AB7V28_05970 [Arcobacteraceae bacterium]